MQALAPVARGELPLVMRADAEDDIRGAVAFASARGLKLVIAGGLEAWRCADLLKEKDVAVLVERRPPAARASRIPTTPPTRTRPRCTRRACASRSSRDDASQSRNLPYEAAMARAFGLPADAALRAITLSPAEIFGVADRIGSIAVGKAANLFLATGDMMDRARRR